MSVRRVQCHHCRGSGLRDLTVRDLTVVERATIQAVGREWNATALIRERLRDIQGYDTKVPALCNRLVDLHSLELVERRALDGKSYEWRAQ